MPALRRNRKSVCRLQAGKGRAIKINKILCATDFSEASFEAVKIANDFARHFSAKLILAHVVTLVTPLPDTGQLMSFDVAAYEDEMRESAQSRLLEIVGKLLSKDVRVSAVVANGEPGAKIAELAEKENADIVVIATHGMTGWRHYAYGSVAQKVIQLTNRPVLVARGRKKRK